MRRIIFIVLASLSIIGGGAIFVMQPVRATGVYVDRADATTTTAPLKRDLDEWITSSGLDSQRQMIDSLMTAERQQNAGMICETLTNLYKQYHQQIEQHVAPDVTPLSYYVFKLGDQYQCGLK